MNKLHIKSTSLATLLGGVMVTALTAQTVQETTTTTQPAAPQTIQQTTTTVQPAPAVPQTVQKTVVVTQPPPREVQQTTTTTTAEGAIGEFGRQAISVTVAPGAPPVRYVASGTTNYEDEAGNPVDGSTLAPGQPVTVHYTKVGDTLFASKVVVRKVVIPAPAAVIQKKVKTKTTTNTVK